MAKKAHINRSAEVELIQRWQRGDDTVAEQLAAAYENLIYKVARRYAGSDLTLLEDLVLVGWHACYKHALPRFDVSKGYRFTTYLTHWVRRDIRSAAVKARQKLTMSLGVCDEIYNHRQAALQNRSNTHTPEKNAELDSLAALKVIELDALRPDARTRLVESVCDDQSADRYRAVECSDEVAFLLSRLEPREVQIIGLSFGFLGEPVSGKAIAKLLGGSPSNINRIRREALRKMRHICTASRSPEDPGG